MIPFILNLKYTKARVIRSRYIDDKIKKKYKEMIIAKDRIVTTSNVVRERIKIRGGLQETLGALAILCLDLNKP